MTNIRFNLPEDVIGELDDYVQNTMPEGYATTMANLIRYAAFHLDRSGSYEIIVDHPAMLLAESAADPLDALAGASGAIREEKAEGAGLPQGRTSVPEDAGAVCRSLLRIFTENLGNVLESDCFYEPARDDMAILRIRYEKPQAVQDVIRNMPSPMLPSPAIEADGSITLLYLPTAKDRGGEIYDVIDRVESRMDGCLGDHSIESSSSF